MWLVFCASDDLPALWAYQGLEALGLTPLELVSADLLAYSLRWEHRLGAGGTATVLTLADGRTIHSGEVRGVLNRLRALPFEHLRRAAPEDAPEDFEYARAEILALFTSWLYALPPPVLNRASPEGLGGQGRHISEWVWLAARAGLVTRPYREAGRPDQGALYTGSRLASAVPVRTVFVVAGRVVGAASGPIRERCLRLAELAGTDLLGIDFAAVGTDPWTFAGATPLPDLRLGGQALLKALMDAFAGGERP
jgi:hypothetical protein